MIHVAGKEREEDWVGIQCVAWFNRLVAWPLVTQPLGQESR